MILFTVVHHTMQELHLPHIVNEASIKDDLLLSVLYRETQVIIAEESLSM